MSSRGEREAFSLSFACFLWLVEVAFHLLRCSIVSVDYPNQLPFGFSISSEFTDKKTGSQEAFTELAKYSWVRNLADSPCRFLMIRHSEPLGGVSFVLSHRNKLLIAEAVKNSKPWAKWLNFLLFLFLLLENVMTVCHLRERAFIWNYNNKKVQGIGLKNKNLQWGEPQHSYQNFWAKKQVEVAC